MNAYSSQYRNNQVMTASPEQILIMLYDGAIRFVRQAQQAIDTDDRPEKSEKIGRAMAIVCEFANTLDHEIGGEIAANLDALYRFMIGELTRANIEGDRKALETVEGLLLELREAWVEAAKIYVREKQAQSPSASHGIAASL